MSTGIATAVGAALGAAYGAASEQLGLFVALGAAAGALLEVAVHFASLWRRKRLAGHGQSVDRAGRKPPGPVA